MESLNLNEKENEAELYSQIIFAHVKKQFKGPQPQMDAHLTAYVQEESNILSDLETIKDGPVQCRNSDICCPF